MSAGYRLTEQELRDALTSAEELRRRLKMEIARRSGGAHCKTCTCFEDDE